MPSNEVLASAVSALCPTSCPLPALPDNTRCPAPPPCPTPPSPVCPGGHQLHPGPSLSVAAALANHAPPPPVWNQQKFKRCVARLTERGDFSAPDPECANDAVSFVSLDRLKRGSTTTIDKLMIVAHSDDETLWGNWDLLSEPGWMIVCVTCGNLDRDDKLVRSGEFVDVVRYVGAVPLMLWFPRFCKDKETNPCEDEWDKHLPDVRRQLQSIITGHAWKKVVVHDPSGEYDHPTHKNVWFLVSELVTDDILFTFDTNEKWDFPEEWYVHLYNMLKLHHSQYHIWGTQWFIDRSIQFRAHKCRPHPRRGSC